MTEILDVESAFETRREETSERSNERSESGQGKEMELVRRVRHGSNRLSNLRFDKWVKLCVYAREDRHSPQWTEQ